MSTTGARYRLQSLTRTYRLLRVAEIALTGVAVALLSFAIVHLLNFSIAAEGSISLLAGGITMFGLSIRSGIFTRGDSPTIHYLNSRYDELEASADLIIANTAELPFLQQLQQSKVSRKLEELAGSIRFPHHLGKALLAFIMSVFVFLLVLKFPWLKNTAVSAPIEQQIAALSQNNEAVRIKNIEVSVTPPAYTSLRHFNAENLHLHFPEGSLVSWKINFSDSIAVARLIISGKDTLAIPQINERFEITRMFTSPGFYQLVWTDNSGKSFSSDFYRIEMIRDEPPQVTVENPGPFTELTYSKNLNVLLNAKLSDDYSLQDAWIVATVAKGSGESVKFREEKLRFDSPTAIQGRLINAGRKIDLNQLGMEPGDELYFYVEAMDTKTPVSNHNRTETFFITIRDTTREEVAFDTGAGVEILPEYFRSQRQIIIDSEKLLEDRKNKKVTVSDFNAKSNELAYDQKQLRLRYGQFMGEEAEGEGTHTAEGDELDNHGKEETIAEKFGHLHDTENEHNLVPDKKPAVGKGKEDATKQFTHTHDNPEEASFFEQSVRAKLKAALALMWDAELHLRMNDPAKSLPFQYRILKLLKEISNDSRVYVRRTGFDPPPVKEEKRLSGDLTEIPNHYVTGDPLPGTGSPTIAQAIPVLESLLGKDTVRLTDPQRGILKQAGNTLASAALEHPEHFLKSLSALKALTSDELPADQQQAAIIEIRKAFWAIVPAGVATPTRRHTTLHALDRSFLKIRGNNR